MLAQFFRPKLTFLGNANSSAQAKKQKRGEKQDKQTEYCTNRRETRHLQYPLANLRKIWRIWPESHPFGKVLTRAKICTGVGRGGFSPSSEMERVEKEGGGRSIFLGLGKDHFS